MSVSYNSWEKMKSTCHGVVVGGTLQIRHDRNLLVHIYFHTEEKEGFEFENAALLAFDRLSEYSWFRGGRPLLVTMTNLDYGNCLAGCCCIPGGRFLYP